MNFPQCQGMWFYSEAGALFKVLVLLKHIPSPVRCGVRETAGRQADLRQTDTMRNTD